MSAVQQTEPEPDIKPKGGIRSELIDSYQIGQWFYDVAGPPKKMESIGSLFYYCNTRPSRGLRRNPVNVDRMIQKWVPVVTGLATAHDWNERDDFESQIDELLTPMLSAPVAQIREFAKKLLVALKAEPTCPLLVWRGFEVWIEKMVLPAEDEDIVKLKTEMAANIARMVEPQIKGDLVQALVGALQWRSESQLVEIEKALKEGGKPTAKRKITGKQSCLFLVVSRGRGKKPVEVML